MVTPISKKTTFGPLNEIAALRGNKRCKEKVVIIEGSYLFNYDYVAIMV